MACTLIAVTIGFGGMYYSNYMQTTGTEQYLDFDENGNYYFDSLYLPEGTDNSRFSEKTFLWDEGIVIDNIVTENGDIEFFCENQGNTMLTVTIPKVYYPNYVARTESGKLSVVKGPYSQVSVCVPCGFSGEIKVGYESPIHWHIMESISAVTALCVVGYLVWNYGKRNRTRGKSSIYETVTHSLG